jgi:hypothetical protein
VYINGHSGGWQAYLEAIAVQACDVRTAYAATNGFDWPGRDATLSEAGTVWVDDDVYPARQQSEEKVERDRGDCGSLLEKEAMGALDGLDAHIRSAGGPGETLAPRSGLTALKSKRGQRISR